VNTDLRPRTLREISERSDSIGDFGRHLRDWLHELRSVSTRRQAVEAIAEEPAFLKERFPEGNVADAWLAAYAEHLAGKIGVSAPEWAFVPRRIAAEPIFDEGSDNRKLRALALPNAPLAFKRRNIFTPSVDLPVLLRAGRPAKSIEEKRRTNAERQRRFRKMRLKELSMLRKLVRRQAKKLKEVP
jgi:hypothetical protein